MDTAVVGRLSAHLNRLREKDSAENAAFDELQEQRTQALLRIDPTLREDEKRLNQILGHLSAAPAPPFIPDHAWFERHPSAPYRLREWRREDGGRKRGEVTTSAMKDGWWLTIVYAEGGRSIIKAEIVAESRFLYDHLFHGGCDD